MKILFLDIDGVLNSHRTAIAFGGYPFKVHGEQRGMFDEVALALIRGIVKTANAQIVLSSSWRTSPEWREIGPALDLPIIDRTPSGLGPRGKEIADWLARHPEVESYAIVDDDSDMLGEQMPFFVKTSGFNGLSWDDACKLADLLGIRIHDVNHPRLREPAAKLAWET